MALGTKASIHRKTSHPKSLKDTESEQEGLEYVQGSVNGYVSKTDGGTIIAYVFSLLMKEAVETSRERVLFTPLYDSDIGFYTP